MKLDKQEVRGLPERVRDTIELIECSKSAGCLVAWLARLSAPSPPDVRALHPGHDPLGILMELSDPLPPAHADTANMGLRSGEKIEIVALAQSELLHRGSGDSLYLCEH